MGKKTERDPKPRPLGRTIASAIGPEMESQIRARFKAPSNRRTETPVRRRKGDKR